MIAASMAQLAGVLSGELIGHDALVQAVTTDSRPSITAPGTLFIALQGKQWNGEQFAAEAIAKGACALLLQRSLPLPVPQIVVPDSCQALRQLAAWLRSQSKARWLAVTGSNGKSSVKEMATAILRQMGNTLATWQNQNNHLFGVPLTLLQAAAEHQFAVVEMAANAPGEIAISSALVRPEVALVTNIAAAHLAGFGSLSGVAKAKGEIFSGLTTPGLAIINQDSHDRLLWEQQLAPSQSVYSFALAPSPGVDFYASAIQPQLEGGHRFILHSPKGTTPVNLPLLGEHMVTNAVAAAALAMAVGADLTAIQRGLEQCRPLKGRLYRQQLAPGKWLIDDSYNSNVASMQAAIRVLQRQPGHRLLVMGDMAELGVYSAECHQQIAEDLQASAIEQLFTIGMMSERVSRAVGGKHFATFEALLEAVVALWQQHPSITLLVKGSRCTNLDRLSNALREQLAC